MSKVTDKLIKEVVANLTGEETVPLVMALKNKMNVSEFKLASSLRKEINETRNMLYKLHDYNLVSFTRKKDKQKGWYIYYWTFNQDHIKYLSKSILKKRIEGLKSRLDREEGANFYACPNACIRLDFDQATNFNYKCPECGSIIEQEDNQTKKEMIRKEIGFLEKELRQKTLASS